MKIQKMNLFHLTVTLATVMIKLMSMLLLTHLILHQSTTLPPLPFGVNVDINVIVQSHKSIVSFGAFFCAPEFYQHLNDQTNLYTSQICSVTPLHQLFIISDLRSHDSGRNEEILTPNFHHRDNQETKMQKVLNWEPVLGTPTVPKTTPCNHLQASLALLHFNDSSLHQAVNSTKQNLLSCNSNPLKTLIILQFLQTPHSTRRDTSYTCYLL